VALADLDWLEFFFGTRATPLLPESEPSATLKQIHSNLVFPVKLDTGCLGEGDALVTNQPGVWLSVRSADCFPVILADPVNRAIGVIHSGWRGAAANIVAATIDTMASHFSTSGQNLHAAIGPGIGKCCFEVGGEVGCQFGYTESGKILLDLSSIISKQLKQHSVGEITNNGTCTKCHPELYHSFRRDGETAGRMISAARIRA